MFIDTRSLLTHDGTPGNHADAAVPTCARCRQRRQTEGRPFPPRPIHDIAHEIVRTWPRVHFAARPYLLAMLEMTRIEDGFGYDSGADVVLRFLGNASTWRGPDARRLKAELRELVK